MKNIFLFLFIFSSIFFSVTPKMNYLKLISCIKNNEAFKKHGEKFLEDFKLAPLTATLAMYPKLEENPDIYKPCLQKANNSFEFDSICVLKCLNEFKNDYDYSCLSSCYY